MKLIVETDNGNQFDVEVGDFDSLQQIKERIQTCHGFPISKQTLSLSGNIISNDIELLCADIDDESVIHLQIEDNPALQPPAKDMFITIKLPPPFNTFDAKVDANDKVEKVKEMIQERVEGTPIERIVLNHEMGMELPNHMTLLECQVLPHSKITVQINPSESTSTSTSTSSQPAPPPTTPTATEGNMMSIVLKLCGRSSRVEVRAAQEVRRLSRRLERLNPHKYSLVHNRRHLLNEDLSFTAQNIAQGDLIEIFLSSFHNSRRRRRRAASS